MKIVYKDQLDHVQLTSQKTAESYSLSAIVSDALDSKQVFIHHDIISPGRRSSAPHRHTLIEEIVYVSKGSVIVVSGEDEIHAPEGSFILFDPKDSVTHNLINKSGQDAETITFSVNSVFDEVSFGRTKDPIQRPSSHFDGG
jgi:uncharacterized cupin superfamily protein